MVDVMGSSWLLMSFVQVFLGNCMVRVVPGGWGSLGVIVAIMTELAKLTNPGVKVMLQPCSEPTLVGMYLEEVG
jgi:hypothetical protein